MSAHAHRRAGPVIAWVAVAGCAAPPAADTAARLESLRQQMAAGPTPEGERAYLAAFPRSYASFRDVFDSEQFDLLYPRYVEHMTLLEQIGGRRPDDVLDLQLCIATGAEWQADAVNMLRDQLAATAAREPDRFARALEARSWSAARSVVTFLADVECHASYHEYELAIDGLRAAGHPQWALEFEQARTARMLQPNH